jgi:transposase
MWIPPECKDPVVLHYPTRKSIGYFGAIRLCDGKLVCQRESNSFNAQSYWKFMKKLRQISCHTGRRVLVLADNARYHHAKLHAQWREQCSDRFSQLFLPPYSPDLNPIERVWKLTRRLATHNRYFETIDHVVDAVERQFKLWSKPNSSLKKLCAII